MKRLLCILIFLFSAALVFSQVNYSVEQINADGLCRISWPHLDNVVRYIVRLEKPGAEPIDIVTVNPQAEIILETGTYRMRVTAYHTEGETVLPWSSITVRAKPVIVSFSPRNINRKEGELRLRIHGKNFVSGMELTLIYESGVVFSPLVFTVESSGRQALAVFEMQNWPVGNYTVYIKNPDGLESSLGTFHISVSKFEVTAAYAPIVPVHGSWFKTFKDFLYPLGAEARGGYFFLLTPIGELGGEVVFAWNYLKTTWDYPIPAQNNVTISSNMIEARINAMLRKSFGRHDVIIRVGGGIVSQLGFKFDFSGGTPPDAKNYISPLAAVGGSYVFNINEAFFGEAGFDYLLVMNKKVSGYIRPFIGAGMRF